MSTKTRSLPCQRSPALLFADDINAPNFEAPFYRSRDFRTSREDFENKVMTSVIRESQIHQHETLIYRGTQAKLIYSYGLSSLCLFHLFKSNHFAAPMNFLKAYFASALG